MATSKKITLPALALMVIGSTAFAQAADVDVDGDGMYSFPELQAAMPDMTDEVFVMLDVSGDGLLDATEIEAAAQAGLLPATDG